MIQDFFVNIIESNIGFEIGNYLILYIISLWMLFCVWVFVDASKRYKNWKLGLIMFLVALIFNFPGLLFYLIIRPEKEEDHILFIGGDNAANMGGVNVPIVNFKGEDGFELSLNISISNKGKEKDVSLPKVNLKMDVDNSEQFEIQKSFQSEAYKQVNVSGGPVIKQQALKTRLKGIQKILQDKFKQLRKAELDDFAQAGDEDKPPLKDSTTKEDSKEKADIEVGEKSSDKVSKNADDGKEPEEKTRKD